MDFRTQLSVKSLRELQILIKFHFRSRRESPSTLYTSENLYTINFLISHNFQISSTFIPTEKSPAIKTPGDYPPRTLSRRSIRQRILIFKERLEVSDRSRFASLYFYFSKATQLSRVKSETVEMHPRKLKGLRMHHANFSLHTPLRGDVSNVTPVFPLCK